VSQGKPVVRALVALGAATLAVAGCGGRSGQPMTPRLSPVATLTATRLHTGSADSAAFELRWSGSVAVGHIDHYLVAIDPQSGNSAWQTTRDTQRTYGFSAPAGPDGTPEPVQHFVAVRAIDGAGDESPTVRRTLAFVTVQILQPAPSPLFYEPALSAVHITWTGEDLDGVLGRPASYKFKLFKDTDAIFGGEPIDPQHRPPGFAEFNYALSNPDYLRRFYAPTFAGFDSVTGGTTSVDYSNLLPDSRYLFVLVGFDDTGGYNLVWTLDSNLLQIVAGTNYPRLARAGRSRGP
jgi:hypothetical protein